MPSRPPAAHPLSAKEKPWWVALETPLLIVMPAAVLVAMIWKEVANAYPGSIVAILWGILLSFAIVAVRVFRIGQEPVIRTAHRSHQRFKEQFVDFGVLTVLGFVALLMVLLLFHPDVETFRSFVEVGVLSVTILFMAFFTRYTATSFTEDVADLGERFNEATSQLSSSFLESSGASIESYNDNMGRLIEQIERQSREQAAILAGLTAAMERVAHLLEKQLSVGEDSKKLAAEALRLQEQEDRVRRELDRQREEGKRARDAAERIRALPRFRVLLRVQGAVAHTLKAWVQNHGMAAKEVQVSLDWGSGKIPPIAAGAVPAQETTLVEFGEADQVPKECEIQVLLTAADAAGRRYRFTATFMHQRVRGVFRFRDKHEFEPDDWVEMAAEPIA